MLSKRIQFQKFSIIFIFIYLHLYLYLYEIVKNDKTIVMGYQ